MDLRKYSVSEFSEMLENEMKLNKEKCEKIAKYYEMKRDIKNDLEITYKIVAPVEKNVYYRRPLEMAYNYESTLWGMKEAQISSFTGVKNCKHYRKKDFYYVSNKKKFLSQIQIRISD